MRAHVMSREMVPSWMRPTLVLWITALLSCSVLGCAEGGEGDRCNPLLSHDECGGQALVCSGPSTPYPLPGACVENYCCPKDPSKSSSPSCNGTDPACAVADASGGADAAAE
jgi:hypothetical protein